MTHSQSKVPALSTGDLTDAGEDARLERIGRFQALEPGTYWRCTVEDGLMDKGVVLLLLDIEMFEGKPHTIVLRSHPRHGSLRTYKVLVDEFLRTWEYALDGEAVRARELAELQGEIVQAQAELMNAQSDPSLVASAVQERLLRWDAENQKEEDRRRKAADGDQGPSTSAQAGEASIERSLAMQQGNGRIRTDLASVFDNRLTGADVHMLTKTVEREAVIAEAKAHWLEGKVGNITSKVTQMAPFFSEKTAVALARTKGVQDYAKELMKGIQTLNLYTGVGVEVHALVTGTSAAEDLPLTLMQRKLFMNEEIAAHIDVNDEFDFDKIFVFDELIANDASLRDRIFPTPRCVVSMAVRRDSVNYGNAQTNVYRNAINKSVFLLVRDGENIHRVHSAEESHENTPRLFPTSDEVDKPFRGYDGSRIDFNDLRFTTAARQAENTSLHYKRLLVLLCGLDHRLGLFGRFHPLGGALSFISLDFQSKYMQFIADDEPGTLIGEGRPSVDQWLNARNAYLQSGSRVLCYHANLIDHETAPSCQRQENSSSGGYINTLADPLKESEILIAYRDGKELCVDVRVSRAKRSWRELTQVEFNARVSLSEAQKSGAMRFVCLDDVEPKDLRWYVQSRENRVRHIDFIRMFKRTAALLESQAEMEAPARAYLKDAVTQGKFCAAEEVDALVSNAIRGWRCANRGAALPALGNTKAFEDILNLAHSLTREKDFGRMLAEHAEKSSLVPLKGVLTGKNRLALYCEVPQAERDERLMPWKWVLRQSIEVLKTKVSVTSKKLVWLDEKPDAKETEIQVWPELSGWINKAPQPATVLQLNAACAIAGEALTRYTGWFLGKGKGIPDEVFKGALAEMRHQQLNSKGGIVRAVNLELPIAAFISTGNGRQRQPELRYLSLTAPAINWFVHFGSTAQAEQAIKVFVRIYKNKEDARTKTQEAFKPRIIPRSGFAEATGVPGLFMGATDSVGEPSWSLALAGWRDEQGRATTSNYWSEGKREVSRSLDAALAFWMQDVQTDPVKSDKHRPERVVICPTILDELLSLPAGDEKARGPLARLLDLPVDAPAALAEDSASGQTA